MKKLKEKSFYQDRDQKINYYRCNSFIIDQDRSKSLKDRCNSQSIKTYCLEFS